MMCLVTYRYGVDEENDECHEEEDADAADEPPLVLLPDDVLQGLPGRGEPQERRLRATGAEEITHIYGDHRDRRDRNNSNLIIMLLNNLHNQYQLVHNVPHSHTVVNQYAAFTYRH